MSRFRNICVGTSLFLFAIAPAQAEEIEVIFGKVKEYAASENYTKAIEELNWAKKELEKAHFKKIESLLPSEVAGFKGGQANSQSAVGITNIEKTYKKDKEQVKLSLAGGSTGGGAMAGFAALGRMAGMMGTQPGVDTFRIEGRTANLQVRNGRAELTVFLESGSFLKLEQNRAKDGTTVKSIAEGMKADIVKLDNYLKGSS